MAAGQAPARQLIYGYNTIMAALSAKRHVFEILCSTSDSRRRRELAAAAQTVGVPWRPVKRRQLEELTGPAVHQGVAAYVEPYNFKPLKDLQVTNKATELGLLLMLDGVTDPRNFGDMVRSAAAFGADALIIPKARTALITPAALKAAAGGFEYVDISRMNLNAAAAVLRESGFWLVGAEAGSSHGHWDFSWPKKTVLVLGGEGSGLSRLMRKNCDYLIKIPLYAPLNSINVAAAAAILLDGYNRRRRSSFQEIGLDND